MTFQGDRQCILSFHSWPKMCDRVIPSAPFNADSPETLPSAQKLFLPTAQHDLLIHFTYFWRSAFRQNRSSLTEFFWSNRLACFGCFRDILSFCQAVSAISPFWHTVCVLDIIVLSWCGIWHYSILLVAKKFGIFERILKFNWYIQVEISDDTFTNSLNSKISTEWMILIFLKWTIPIMWSSIPNRSRSSIPNRCRSLIPNRCRSSIPNRCRSSVPNRSRSSIPDRCRSSIPDRCRSSIPDRCRSSI